LDDAAALTYQQNLFAALQEQASASFIAVHVVKEQLPPLVPYWLLTNLLKVVPMDSQ